MAYTADAARPDCGPRQGRAVSVEWGTHGGLAQLGERRVRNAEVGGSNPLPSTKRNTIENSLVLVPVVLLKGSFQL